MYIGFWFGCALMALSSAAQAQQPQFSPADVARLLDKRTELMKELEALRTRLTQLWSLPAVAPDPQQSTIEISMKLKRDGTLDGPPEVLTHGDSAWFKAARDGALRAIDRGQPFTMLKPEQYDQWKEIVVTFDSRFVRPR
jgi:colicin import membrane protein